MKERIGVIRIGMGERVSKESLETGNMKLRRKEGTRKRGKRTIGLTRDD